MRILNSALKHGLSEDEITYAFQFPIWELVLRDSPLKVAIIGLGEHFHYLEVFYTLDEQSGEVIIFHAMKASRQLLNRARRETGRRL